MGWWRLLTVAVTRPVVAGRVFRTMCRRRDDVADLLHRTASCPRCQQCTRFCTWHKTVVDALLYEEGLSDDHPIDALRRRQRITVSLSEATDGRTDKSRPWPTQPTC